ncbi:hypothetical protein ACIREO_18320 [Streptomyces sp. NPDC102441]
MCTGAPRAPVAADPDVASRQSPARGSTPTPAPGWYGAGVGLVEELLG